MDQEEKETDYIIKNDEYFIKLKNGKEIPVTCLQKEILSIMVEIDRVCRKNNIKYCLIAGSTLGAYNYGGFIPWDDDIDVSIPIENWDRFISALQEDMSDEFYFDCYEIDKRYNTIMGPWMKVRKRGTYIEEVNFLLKNRCKRGNGVFVDVIPYGGVSENKLVDQLERTVVKVTMPFIVLLDNIHINPVPLKSFVYWFSKKCLSWHKDSNLISQPVSVPWEKFLREPIFKKDDVYPVREYDFEGHRFYSYNNAETIMKKWYGKNCLKYREDERWCEPLPKPKRHIKHTKDLNLNGENPSE